MNTPPPNLFKFCPPRSSVAEFVASRKAANVFGCSSNLTCTTTTISSTKLSSNLNAVSKNLENARKITHIISLLRDTHLNFNKIQNLQKNRLRYLQNLIRKKNKIISQLSNQLELSNKTKTLNKFSNNKNKYLGVIRCNHVIRTILGSEKFVRRRLAELCALHKTEYIYCATCTGEEREDISQMLLKMFLTRVIIYKKNKRFEFLTEEEAQQAQTLIYNYLKNEY